jgi:hypothetical protein
MAGHSDEPGERQVDLRIFKNRYGPLGRVSNSVVFLRPCWGMRVEQNPITGFARELMEAMEFDTAYSIREIQRALGKSKHQTIKKHLIYLEGRDIVYETTGKWVRPSAGTQRGATRPGTQKGGGQVAPEQDEFNYAN